MNTPTTTLTRPKLSGGSALVCLVLLSSLTACGGDEEDATITVLAAASLTETFEDLATTFETDHPGVEVRLAFDSSATLSQQVLEGAPADVLATADTATMGSAADALDGEPQVFASNSMVMVVPADNPAGLSGFADLATDEESYVVCVETAPCGKTARTLLDTNGVTTEPSSLEVDAKAVLAKVVGDEADAGLVYATDALAAGDQVEQFEIPLADDARTTYPVALLRQSTQPDLARQFVDLVFSAEGQQVLADAGFGQP